MAKKEEAEKKAGESDLKIFKMVIEGTKDGIVLDTTGNPAMLIGALEITKATIMSDTNANISMMGALEPLIAMIDAVVASLPGGPSKDIDAMVEGVVKEGKESIDSIMSEAIISNLITAGKIDEAKGAEIQACVTKASKEGQSVEEMTTLIDTMAGLNIKSEEATVH